MSLSAGACFFAQETFLANPAGEICLECFGHLQIKFLVSPGDAGHSVGTNAQALSSRMRTESVVLQRLEMDVLWCFANRLSR